MSNETLPLLMGELAEEVDLQDGVDETDVDGIDRLVSEDKLTAVSKKYVLDNVPSPIPGSILVASNAATTPVVNDTTYTLIIHSPFDHCKKIELAVGGKWTLLDVFNQLKNMTIASMPPNAKSDDYCFLSFVKENTQGNILEEIERYFFCSG